MGTPHTACSVCSLSYDDETRRPLVLPCSHSFCQECLQLFDRNKDKLCPCCKKSWQNIKIYDLPFCKQLVSMEISPAEEAQELDLCDTHRVCATLWCNSCHAPLCKNCLYENHKECRWVLIKEKRAELQKKYTETLQELKQVISFDYSALYEEELNAINFIEEEIVRSKDVLQKYKDTYDQWLTVTKKKTMPQSCSFEFYCKDSVQNMETELNKLEMPEKPQSILKLFAKAYKVIPNFGKNESGSDLIKNLSNFYKSEFPSHVKQDKDSTHEESFLKDGTESFLKDGTEWILHDSLAVPGAIKTITKTSARPTLVTFKGRNWHAEDVEKLVDARPSMKCDIKFVITDSFWELSNKSREKTLKLLYVLMSQPFSGSRYTLVELNGHLDAAAIDLLPKTVRRVGLVLASAEDMEAANYLLKIASERRLQEIDLSILQTIRVEDWNIKWPMVKSVQVNSGLRQVQRPVECYDSNVKRTIHFPNINDSNTKWMLAIVEKITEKFSNVSFIQRLYLPGTTLTPDAVLGVIRDAGLICEVHLPPGLTAEHDREEVAVQYGKYNCTVVWDAE